MSATPEERDLVKKYREAKDINDEKLQRHKQAEKEYRDTFDRMAALGKQVTALAEKGTRVFYCWDKHCLVVKPGSVPEIVPIERVE